MGYLARAMCQQLRWVIGLATISSCPELVSSLLPLRLSTGMFLTGCTGLELVGAKTQHPHRGLRFRAMKIQENHCCI